MQRSQRWHSKWKQDRCYRLPHCNSGWVEGVSQGGEREREGEREGRREREERERENTGSAVADIGNTLQWI